MNSQPKQGIYLDAALAVIGEQVDERIDEIERRRRRSARWGVAALSLAVVASGSVAAVALSAQRAADVAPPPVAATVAHELRCVEGADAGAASYFTMRFRSADADVTDTAAALCDRAWKHLGEDGDALRSASPAELVALAETFAAADDIEIDVTRAAFGAREASGGARAFVTCAQGADAVVLTLRGDLPTRADQLALCARSGA